MNELFKKFKLRDMQLELKMLFFKKKMKKLVYVLKLFKIGKSKCLLIFVFSFLQLLIIFWIMQKIFKLWAALYSQKALCVWVSYLVNSKWFIRTSDTCRYNYRASCRLKKSSLSILHASYEKKIKTSNVELSLYYGAFLDLCVV